MLFCVGSVSRHHPPQNKSEIPVPFSVREKVSGNSPRLPRNPPQTHHKSTTPAHPFSPITPTKHHKPTPNYFRRYSPDFPPLFRTSTTSRIRIPLSSALVMSYTVSAAIE